MIVEIVLFTQKKMFSSYISLLEQKEQTLKIRNEEVSGIRIADK